MWWVCDYLSAVCVKQVQEMSRDKTTSFNSLIKLKKERLHLIIFLQSHCSSLSLSVGLGDTCVNSQSAQRELCVISLSLCSFINLIFPFFS